MVRRGRPASRCKERRRDRPHHRRSQGHGTRKESLMKKGTSKRLTPEQRAELKSLAALRDDAIDTSDAPELLDWSGAKRGLFYRAVKQQRTLRLDADVVAWFKSHTTSNEGYQTRINRALREYVQEQASRTRRSRA